MLRLVSDLIDEICRVHAIERISRYVASFKQPQVLASSAQFSAVLLSKFTKLHYIIC